METKLTLLIVQLLHILTSTSQLSISVCDCANPVTKGLLDLNDPEYCFKQEATKEDKEKETSRPLTYRIVTKQAHTLKVPAFVCSKWIETKKITGNFWIGSFDTEYYHTTQEVNPTECWEMKDKLKCGNNKNVVNGPIYSFIQKPTGSGFWMATREYSVINCHAQDIELRRESNNGPLLSPFGVHNVSIEAQHLVVNHYTIVWHIPTDLTIDPACTESRQFKGTGKVSYIYTTDNGPQNKTRIGRVIDTTKQLEILFDPQLEYVCDKKAFSNKVIGIPDTYVVFDMNPYTLLHRTILPPASRESNRSKRSLQIQKTLDIFAWGHLSTLAILAQTEADKDYENKNNVLTTANIYSPLFVMPMLSSDPTHKVASRLPNTQQLFEFTVDQRIRFNLREINYCLSADESKYLSFTNCDHSPSTWIYDNYRMYFMEARTKKCLTVNTNDNELRTVSLEDCDLGIAQSSKQMWRFEHRTSEKMVFFPTSQLKIGHLLETIYRVHQANSIAPAPVSMLSTRNTYLIGDSF